MLFRSEWVPKCPSSALNVQINSKKIGHKGTEKRKKPRVPHAPKKKTKASITSKRTLKAPIAGTTKFKHQRKQWTQARRVCSTSRTSYHRVPLNYLEENKKKRVPQVSNRRYLKPVPFVKTLQTPKRHWVCKVNPPST